MGADFVMVDSLCILAQLQSCMYVCTKIYGSGVHRQLTCFFQNGGQFVYTGPTSIACVCLY